MPHFGGLVDCLLDLVLMSTWRRVTKANRTSTEDGDNTSHTDTVVDVFERFKNYLDEKVESLSSGLVSRTATETQKLSRVAELRGKQGSIYL